MPISDPAGLAAFVGDLLRKNKLSIATAESLTEPNHQSSNYREHNY